MRRFFTPLLSGILLLLLVLCPLTAQAEKVNWEDKAYDFTKIKEAIIHDLVIVDTSEIPSDLTEKVVQEEFLKTAARPPYKMLRPEQNGVLHPLEAADIYVKAEILKWHDDYYIKPAYTDWETRSATRKVKRSDGSWYDETYYYTVPVYHPAETVYTSTVRVKFDVYDMKTDKLVMSRDELRVRDGSYHGQEGIFGRISKSFFDDLGKKIKSDKN
ncbi:hypothetical protein D081_1569 [Anaerovibrio sp. JC8]|uniref:hypothetical protein n=1 Tax=Anaerovibrio sp. JC8 TaxID=1240085 RepID=UPI000A0DE7F2|nr:hypothetical protein [Anaerovibrio sp. JC8]ORT99988.1 hypothetical protein D081_1569 [Anaerovibrio sp. JC8]